MTCSPPCKRASQRQERGHSVEAAGWPHCSGQLATALGACAVRLYSALEGDTGFLEHHGAPAGGLTREVGELDAVARLGSHTGSVARQ
jgi:hypothetical protein